MKTGKQKDSIKGKGLEQKEMEVTKREQEVFIKLQDMKKRKLKMSIKANSLEQKDQEVLKNLKEMEARKQEMSKTFQEMGKIQQ